jgi:dipeptidyl aminopeptidase/acylaminoacyl peptidase
MPSSENDLSNYQIPHEAIYDLANAELAPLLRMDTIGKYAILLYRHMYKSLDEIAAEELKLAGVRINPITNSTSRENYFYKLTILDVGTGEEHIIEGLPIDQKYCRLSRSYDENYAAIINVCENGVESWYIDIEKKKAVKLTDRFINGNIGTSLLWLRDNSLLVSVLPSNRPTIKSKKTEVVKGPIIAENAGQSIETRTFQDLLKNEIDSFNFEVITTSEIWHYKLNGSKTLWKSAAMHDGMSLSPDGTLVLLSEIKKPFSYFVPFDRFPYSTYVYDISGVLLKTIVDSPLLEYLPQGFMAVQQGMRNIKWRSDHPSTLVWVEALDEGNPEKEVSHRDAIYQQSYPFTDTPTLIFKTVDRFAGVFFAHENLALVYDRWWKNRNQRIILFNPNVPDDFLIFNERNFQDVHDDPGNFVMHKNENGYNVLLVDEEENMYLNGDQYAEEGKHSFIDKFNLLTNEKTRIYQSNLPGKQEDIAAVIDVKEGKILTMIQSPHDYPTYYFRNIYTAELKAIMPFENPFKVMEQVHKEIIQYKREDDVDLHGTLYLPVNYDKIAKPKVPLILWAYPTEYKDKATAGQQLNTNQEFIYPFWGSPLYWVTRGYAVLDEASFPILGEAQNQPNDNFLPQLKANAKAAIDSVDALGYIDRNRVAVGGHSYGAFMTAMLLTYTDYFAAGIARSGAYNRTLTPFGFQGEERNYWQAKEVYNTMNPFIDADKMKTPLLLIHGEADNNSGTYTIQTERYFAALKALGANVRMVILPYESHAYAAKDSIMHVLWEQDQWLDKWVKNKL